MKQEYFLTSKWKLSQGTSTLNQFTQKDSGYFSNYLVIQAIFLKIFRGEMLIMQSRIHNFSSIVCGIIYSQFQNHFQDIYIWHALQFTSIGAAGWEVSQVKMKLGKISRYEWVNHYVASC